LERFYEGRTPSWYRSAVAPLGGARRALDIGCGPGLALAQLLDDGAEAVLGIDRWPAFARRAEENGVPYVLHDLTLPMPFLESGSFDGILSHYVLNYMSPIGVRQVLRECGRILASEGLLLLYLGAIGLGSGDDSQTVPYREDTVGAMLSEAGFAEIELETSPNGRNTVARAKRPVAEPRGTTTAATPTALRTAIPGEAQLTASAKSGAGDGVGAIASGEGRSVGLRLPSPPTKGRLSLCARVVAADSGPGSELQLWAWDGTTATVSDSVKLGFFPDSLQLECDGALECLDSWTPGHLALESGGSAFVRPDGLVPAAELGEGNRGAEGRMLVVEQDPLDDADWERLVGPGRNRFPIVRVRKPFELSRPERLWRTGRALGIVLDAAEIGGDEIPTPSLWAAARGAPLMVEGAGWSPLLAAALSLGRASEEGPVLLSDPALGGGPREDPPEEVLTLVERRRNLFLVIPAPPSIGLRSRLGERVLIGGGGPGASAELAEPLRYVTERALLARMRTASDLGEEHLGRRQGL
jgi:hypothetical protein